MFAWRAGNSFELLHDGPAFFPKILQAIDQAQRRVDVELYLVEDGQCADLFIEHLIDAVRRGVTVRCLFDAFGSSRLSARARERLLQGAVLLRFYNPIHWRRGLGNLYRDHRKLVLIDGYEGFVGGTGVSDDFWQPGHKSASWHELMVAMRGPILADWQQLFERQWQDCMGDCAWRAHGQWAGQTLPGVPAAGRGTGRVAYGDALQHRDIVQALLHHLLQAKQLVWLATPYFLPTWKVRRALRKAARRGVDVRLLLTGRHTDHAPVRYAGQRYYRRLLRSGVRIFEYQPRFLHLKMVLVDNWLSIGSCNFDHWNLRWNLDANLEALDPELTAQAQASFISDFAQSLEITQEHWQKRSLLERLRSHGWGWLDRVVVNLLDRRH